MSQLHYRALAGRRVFTPVHAQGCVCVCVCIGTRKRDRNMKYKINGIKCNQIAFDILLYVLKARGLATVVCQGISKMCL